MRRLVLALVMLPLLTTALVADAGAKKRAKCARFHEQTGCKLRLGDAYYVKGKSTRIDVYARGFNLSDVTVKNASCADGTKASYIFDVATADTGNTKAVKIGQKQSYNAQATYILNGEDEVPVTFDGTVTFTSAQKATLQGTVSAKLPTDAGPAKDCSGTVKVNLKRLIEA